MKHYQQRLNLKADPARVYAALTTPEGLRAWWTQDCDVATEPGDTISFRFGPNYKDMRIERLEPGREVRWHCTRAHIAAEQLTRRDEWVGTQVVFRLQRDDKGGTRLDFEHIGLVPEMQCYELCSGGWQYFMHSLQQYADTGNGTPWQADLASCGSKGASTMTENSTDRVERSILIQAPRDRVWRALSNAEDFGTWFGADLTGQRFAPGERARGNITIKGCEHVPFDIIVERMEAPTLMSYRWHPYNVDPAVDYDQEERTLVTFTLADASNGTLLTVVESGFDKVPPHRRMEAFRMNNSGWGFQLENIARHASSQ